MKIAFTMIPHSDQPKNSTRWNFDGFVLDSNGPNPTAEVAEKFKPSFYIPRPFAVRAKRIRVIIEEID